VIMQARSKSDYLFLNWLIRRNDEGELLAGYHLASPAPSLARALQTDVTCELSDAKGRILANHQCHGPTSEEDHEKADQFFLSEILPWYPGITKITLRRGKKILHTTNVEERPPTVSITVPAPVEGQGTLMKLEWQAHHPDKVTSCMLRYSNNAGDDWRCIASGLKGYEHLVDLDYLPGGADCIFQVVASAGVRTAIAQTASFSIERRARQAHILMPTSGASFVAAMPVVLKGFGFSPDFPTIEPHELTWTSSVNGLLGVGAEIAATGLPMGHSSILLSMPNGLGGETVSSVSIAMKR
jgi:hypothetical protein